MHRFLGVLLLTLSFPARAENPELRAAQRSFDQLQIERSLKLASKALARPNLPRSDLIAIYQLQGLGLAILGDKAKARESMRRLLMIEPSHQLPNFVAPRFRRFFQDTRRRFAAEGWIEAANTTPSASSGPVTVSCGIDNDPLVMVVTARVTWRTDGGSWQTTTVPAESKVRVQLDVGRDAGGVEFFWTLTNEFGGELLSLGSEDAPLVVSLPGASESEVGAVEAPIWTEWWLWTAVGVVVVGAATTTILLTQPTTPACPSGAHCDRF